MGLAPRHFFERGTFVYRMSREPSVLLTAILCVSQLVPGRAAGAELEFSVAGLDAAANYAHFSVAKREFQQCHLADNSNDIDCLQLSPLPHTFTAISDLPKNWDWRRAHGDINYVVPTLNQHIPQYCGACWIFATIHALSDRIKIARNALTPEITLSPQALLNCGIRMKTDSWEHMNCHAVPPRRRISTLPSMVCQIPLVLRIRHTPTNVTTSTHATTVCTTPPATRSSTILSTSSVS